MHVADWRIAGWFPLQHHDPSVDVGARKLLGAVRVHPTDEPGDEDPGRDTYGDVQGGLLWRSIDDRRDHCNAWFMTGAPVVATSGAAGSSDPALTTIRPGPEAWKPALTSDSRPDDRFEAKRPGRPTWWDGVWPTGWTGELGAGSSEAAQEEILHPDFWGLVAVNRAGSPRAGTPVFDLDELGRPNRFARLQSLLTVLDFVAPVAGLPRGTKLALQLGRGGRLDGGSGHALWVDHDFAEVACGGVDQGGPLTGGRGVCQHPLGIDADGNVVRPMHLAAGQSSGTLFVAPWGADAPVRFNPDPWVPPSTVPMPMWRRCHVRLNRELFHRHGAAAGVGMWEIQVDVPIYVPPPIGEPPPRKPPPGGDPPPPPPPPPGGDPPPLPPPGGEPPPPIGDVFPPHGSGDPPPSSGGKPPPWRPPIHFGPPGVGSGGETPPLPPRGGRIPTFSGVGPAKPPPVSVGTPVTYTPDDYLPPVETTGGTPFPGGRRDPLQSFPFDLPDDPFAQEAIDQGLLDDGPGTATGYGGEQTVGGDSKPAYPHSPSCMVLPNVIFKASPTVVGSPTASGSTVVSPETLRAFEDAPQTAQLEGWAKGDGTATGFSGYKPNDTAGWAMGPGGLLLLPPDVTAAAYIESVQDGPAVESAAPVAMVYPPGLSSVAHADADRSTGAVVDGFVTGATPGGGTLTTIHKDGDGATGAGTQQTSTGHLQTIDSTGAVKGGIQADGSTLVDGQSGGAIDAAPSGHAQVFLDDDTGEVSAVHDDGAVVSLEGGGGSGGGNNGITAFPQFLYYTTSAFNKDFFQGPFGIVNVQAEGGTIALDGTFDHGRFVNVFTARAPLDEVGIRIVALWNAAAGIPSDFSDWGTNGITIWTFVAGDTPMGGGDSIRLNLSVFDPSDGETLVTVYRTISADDTDFVALTLDASDLAGVFEPGDMLRIRVWTNNEVFNGFNASAVDVIFGRLEVDFGG